MKAYTNLDEALEECSKRNANEAKDRVIYDFLHSYYYDYRRAITDNILDYLAETDARPDMTEQEREALEEELHDELWTADSVTGNGSGSYTFDRATASAYIKDNMDLYFAAMRAFGGHNPDRDPGEPETIDVTIRCYLLRECITKALDEFTGKEE